MMGKHHFFVFVVKDDFKMKNEKISNETCKEKSQRKMINKTKSKHAFRCTLSHTHTRTYMRNKNYITLNPSCIIIHLHKKKVMSLQQLKNTNKNLG